MNKDYWVNKDDRKRIAAEHTKQMDKDFHNEIINCINNTITYSSDYKFRAYDYSKSPMYKIEDIDSVSAVMKYTGGNYGKAAVLNFASYKNPGGMFLNGSIAQEEALCHESFLYNVLRECPDYYAWNNEHKNKALYLNRALYTPNVVFLKDGKQTTCDVITCAAPNYTAAEKYAHVSKEENLEVLRSRIKFVCDVANENRVNTLILGAFGCGVFGQDAREVGRLFAENIFSKPFPSFRYVIFAVIGRGGNNIGKLTEGIKSIF